MYRKVLLAFDASPCAGMALREALRIAEAGAALRILTVVPALGPSLLPGGEAPDATLAVDLARESLQHLRGQLEAEGVSADFLLLDMTEKPDGDVAEEILAEARDWQADLIVLGTHGRRGLKRLLMGSVAESIVRTAFCPVLLVRGAPDPSFDCLRPAEVYGMWPAAS